MARAACARSWPAINLGEAMKNHWQKMGALALGMALALAFAPCLPASANDSGLHANRSAGPRQQHYFFRSHDQLGNTHGRALNDHRVLRCERKYHDRGSGAEYGRVRVGLAGARQRALSVPGRRRLQRLHSSGRGGRRR